MGERINIVSLFQIKEDVKGGHYGLACGKVFNFKHNSSIDYSPTHPNEYYETNRNLRDGKISAEGTCNEVSLGLHVIDQI